RATYPPSLHDALPILPSWAPSRPMTLGLDLQGGSHILLQVERNSLVSERLASVRDDVRSVLREKRIGYTGLSTAGQSVQVRIRRSEEHTSELQSRENL